MSPDEVHIFRSSLQMPDPVVGALCALLSTDEQQRAAQFRVAIERRRYTVARALLRLLLGAYLDRAASALKFTYGQQGKPRLSAPEEAPPLEFNLSHSQDLVLYALSTGIPVGIDVERIESLADADSVAAQFFSANELQAWRSLPAGERMRAFYRCWTRKEALVKATGLGLSYPLDRFDVSLGERAKLLRLESDESAASQWTLYDCQLDQSAVGALAVLHPKVRIAEFSLALELSGKLIIEQLIHD